jgi:Phosphoglucose isomerase
MGVELGKVLAKNILAQLDKSEDVKGHDSSVSWIFLVFNSRYHLPSSLFAPILIRIDRPRVLFITIRSIGKSDHSALGKEQTNVPPLSRNVACVRVTCIVGYIVMVRIFLVMENRDRTG